MNGGRAGAAEGPTAFRAALARYGAAEPSGFAWPGVFDAGDVVPAEGDGESALHETHRRVTEAVTTVLDRGLLPVAVGGGHDLSYPFVRAAVVHARKKNPRATIGGVYLDAHLDVRETAGSGMWVRRLIEDCRVGPINCLGASPLVNSGGHLAWFAQQGGCLEGKRLADGQNPPNPDAVFVSVDLDVLDMAYAPGVSAMNPSGMAPGQVSQFVLGAGSSPGLLCFDLMELCPRHDEGGRTARLAAHLFLVFLRGLAARAG
jgi:arginase family enzyme